LIEEFAGLVVYLIALLGGMSFIALIPVVLLSAVRPWNPHKLIIPSMMMIAFFIGGILSWNLIPFHWDMSFWTTLAASVQSEKYGHLVEHKAEGILIWVLFFAVSSGAVTGMVAVVATKVRKRLQVA
jgi:hypothetical protein